MTTVEDGAEPTAKRRWSNPVLLGAVAVGGERWGGGTRGELYLHCVVCAFGVHKALTAARAAVSTRLLRLSFPSGAMG